MTIQEKLNSANLLVKEFKSLRNLQKEYFRYRDTKTLEKCKLQEKKVDELLNEYNKQPELFS